MVEYEFNHLKKKLKTHNYCFHFGIICFKWIILTQNSCMSGPMALRLCPCACCLFKTLPMRLLPLSTSMPFFILLLLFSIFLNLVYTQMAGQDDSLAVWACVWYFDGWCSLVVMMPVLFLLSFLNLMNMVHDLQWLCWTKDLQ